MKGQFSRRDFESYYRILRCQYLEDARSWLERSGELADAELEHRIADFLLYRFDKGLSLYANLEKAREMCS